MPVSLDELDAEFRTRLTATIAACATAGIDMIPYFAIRTPFDQGKLWRQSRSHQEIAAKLAELNANGATFLAHCIDSVGPQHGPHVTNAIPGYSWHQWGEACDCYWLRDGKAEWDVDVLGSNNGYRIYAERGTLQGLTAGGYWQSLKDWPHVQKRRASSPAADGLALAQIDAQMQDVFG
jgi:peptidoglycan L-alanyl-D-glutamate endopeptidase CwlK